MIAPNSYFFCAAFSFFSLIHPLCAIEYGVFAKRETSEPITKFFVISERCSGSNYIVTLLEKNSGLFNQPLGHKHFPPWYDLPETYYLGNPQYYTFDKTENYLIILNFRGPYDWLRSFHLKPYHGDNSSMRIPFDQFINTAWISNPLDKTIVEERGLNQFLDLDINNSFAPFKNVMALRTAKIKNMLQVKDKAPNVYLINYEVVRDFPKKVLEEISRLFAIDLKPVFEPITTYVGGINRMDKYKPKKYCDISNALLEHINCALDEAVENEIGYQLVEDPEKLDEAFVF